MDNLSFKASNMSQVNVDQALGIVECFVAGIGNKDSVGDVVISGAFAKSLTRRKPRVVWGHSWNDPIGKVLEMYEVPVGDSRLPQKMRGAGIGGLYAKVQFNLNSEKGKEAFANVAFFGEDQEWSIGYKTIDSVFDQSLQANILKEVELYEVSPVLHGANQLTGTISIKADEKGYMPIVPMPSGVMPGMPGMQDMPRIVIIRADGGGEEENGNPFAEGLAQPLSEPEKNMLVAELTERTASAIEIMMATENSVVFKRTTSDGKSSMYRMSYHKEGDRNYMFGKPESYAPSAPVAQPMQSIQQKPDEQIVVPNGGIAYRNDDQQEMMGIFGSDSAKAPWGKSEISHLIELPESYFAEARGFLNPVLRHHKLVGKPNSKGIVIEGLMTANALDALQNAVKALGATIGNTIGKVRDLAQTFNPYALDGDGDGFVQDGSAFQRPYIPIKKPGFDLPDVRGQQRDGGSLLDKPKTISKLPKDASKWTIGQRRDALSAGEINPETREDLAFLSNKRPENEDVAKYWDMSDAELTAEGNKLVNARRQATGAEKTRVDQELLKVSHDFQRRASYAETFGQEFVPPSRKPKPDASMDLVPIDITQNQSIAGMLGAPKPAKRGRSEEEGFASAGKVFDELNSGDQDEFKEWDDLSDGEKLDMFQDVQEDYMYDNYMELGDDGLVEAMESGDYDDEILEHAEEVYDKVKAKRTKEREDKERNDEDEENRRFAQSEAGRAETAEDDRRAREDAADYDIEKADEEELKRRERDRRLDEQADAALDRALEGVFEQYGEEGLASRGSDQAAIDGSDNLSQGDGEFGSNPEDSKAAKLFDAVLDKYFDIFGFDIPERDDKGYDEPFGFASRGNDEEVKQSKVNELVDAVRDRLIAELETADPKTWRPSWRNNALPVNPVTGKPYRGFNAFVMMARVQGSKYATGRFAGFNQLKARGAIVRKGEKGVPILRPQLIKTKDADGKEGERIVFRGATVFNIDQTDGGDEALRAIPESLPESERLKILDETISELGVKVQTENTTPHYNPDGDYVSMPEFSTGVSAIEWSSTLAHETVHWTGHGSRLGRPSLKEYSTDKKIRAYEELVAEIGSAMLLAAHGIEAPFRQDHAPYIKGWMDLLKDDPEALNRAFKDSQAALNFLLEKSPNLRKLFGGLDNGKKAPEVDAPDVVGATVGSSEGFASIHRVPSPGSKAVADILYDDNTRDLMVGFHKGKPFDELPQDDIDDYYEKAKEYLRINNNYTRDIDIGGVAEDMYDATRGIGFYVYSDVGMDEVEELLAAKSKGKHINALKKIKKARKASREDVFNFTERSELIQRMSRQKKDTPRVNTAEEFLAEVSRIMKTTLDDGFASRGDNMSVERDPRTGYITVSAMVTGDRGASEENRGTRRMQITVVGGSLTEAKRNFRNRMKNDKVSFAGSDGFASQGKPFDELPQDVIDDYIEKAKEYLRINNRYDRGIDIVGVAEDMYDATQGSDGFASSGAKKLGIEPRFQDRDWVNKTQQRILRSNMDFQGLSENDRIDWANSMLDDYLRENDMGHGLADLAKGRNLSTRPDIELLNYAETAYARMSDAHMKRRAQFGFDEDGFASVGSRPRRLNTKPSNAVDYVAHDEKTGRLFVAYKREDGRGEMYIYEDVSLEDAEVLEGGGSLGKAINDIKRRKNVRKATPEEVIELSNTDSMERDAPRYGQDKAKILSAIQQAIHGDGRFELGKRESRIDPDESGRLILSEGDETRLVVDYDPEEDRVSTYIERYSPGGREEPGEWVADEALNMVFDDGLGEGFILADLLRLDSERERDLDAESRLDRELDSAKRELDMAGDAPGVESVDVTFSSALDAVDYNPSTQELRVSYKDGGTYIYEGVDRAAFDEFGSAPSKGRAINEIKRNNPFRKDTEWRGGGEDDKGIEEFDVRGSKAVEKVSYNPEKEELTVVYEGGKGYVYSGVTREEADAVRSAPSKGRAINDVKRTHDVRKAETPVEAGSGSRSKLPEDVSRGKSFDEKLELLETLTQEEDDLADLLSGEFEGADPKGDYLTRGDAQSQATVASRKKYGTDSFKLDSELINSATPAEREKIKSWLDGRMERMAAERAARISRAVDPAPVSKSKMASRKPPRGGKRVRNRSVVIKMEQGALDEIIEAEGSGTTVDALRAGKGVGKYTKGPRKGKHRGPDTIAVRDAETGELLHANEIELTSTAANFYVGRKQNASPTGKKRGFIRARSYAGRQGHEIITDEGPSLRGEGRGMTETDKRVYGLGSDEKNREYGLASGGNRGYDKRYQTYPRGSEGTYGEYLDKIKEESDALFESMDSADLEDMKDTLRQDGRLIGDAGNSAKEVQGLFNDLYQDVVALSRRDWDGASPSRDGFASRGSAETKQNLRDFVTGVFGKDDSDFALGDDENQNNEAIDVFLENYGIYGNNEDIYDAGEELLQPDSGLTDKQKEFVSAVQSGIEYRNEDAYIRSLDRGFASRGLRPSTRRSEDYEPLTSYRGGSGEDGYSDVLANFVVDSINDDSAFGEWIGETIATDYLPNEEPGSEVFNILKDIADGEGIELEDYTKLPKGLLDEIDLYGNENQEFGNLLAESEQRDREGSSGFASRGRSLDFEETSQGSGVWNATGNNPRQMRGDSIYTITQDEDGKFGVDAAHGYSYQRDGGTDYTEEYFDDVFDTFEAAKEFVRRTDDSREGEGDEYPRGFASRGGGQSVLPEEYDQYGLDEDSLLYALLQLDNEDGIDTDEAESIASYWADNDGVWDRYLEDGISNADGNVLDGLVIAARKAYAADTDLGDDERGLTYGFTSRGDAPTKTSLRKDATEKRAEIRSMIEDQRLLDPQEPSERSAYNAMEKRIDDAQKELRNIERQIENQVVRSAPPIGGAPRREDGFASRSTFAARNGRGAQTSTSQPSKLRDDFAMYEMLDWSDLDDDDKNRFVSELDRDGVFEAGDTPADKMELAMSAWEDQQQSTKDRESEKLVAEIDRVRKLSEDNFTAEERRVGNHDGIAFTSVEESIDNPLEADFFDYDDAYDRIAKLESFVLADLDEKENRNDADEDGSASDGFGSRGGPDDEELFYDDERRPRRESRRFASDSEYGEDNEEASNMRQRDDGFASRVTEADRNDLRADTANYPDDYATDVANMAAQDAANNFARLNNEDQNMYFQRALKNNADSGMTTEQILNEARKLAADDRRLAELSRQAVKIGEASEPRKIDVSSSSALNSVRYDDKNKVLEVEYRGRDGKGAGTVYEYQGVEKDVVDRIEAADSRGATMREVRDNYEFTTSRKLPDSAYEGLASRGSRRSTSEMEAELDKIQYSSSTLKRMDPADTAEYRKKLIDTRNEAALEMVQANGLDPKKIRSSYDVSTDEDDQNILDRFDEAISDADERLDNLRSERALAEAQEAASSLALGEARDVAKAVRGGSSERRRNWDSDEEFTNALRDDYDSLLGDIRTFIGGQSEGESYDSLETMTLEHDTYVFDADLESLDRLQKSINSAQTEDEFDEIQRDMEKIMGGLVDSHENRYRQDEAVTEETPYVSDNNELDTELLSSFMMREDVDGFASRGNRRRPGRRNQGGKQERMAPRQKYSDEDRQNLADGNILRSRKRPGKRKQGPSAEEFDGFASSNTTLDTDTDVPVDRGGVFRGGEHGPGKEVSLSQMWKNHRRNISRGNGGKFGISAARMDPFVNPGRIDPDERNALVARRVALEKRISNLDLSENDDIALVPKLERSLALVNDRISSLDKSAGAATVDTTAEMFGVDNQTASLILQARDGKNEFFTDDPYLLDKISSALGYRPGTREELFGFDPLAYFDDDGKVAPPSADFSDSDASVERQIALDRARRTARLASREARQVGKERMVRRPSTPQSETSNSPTQSGDLMTVQNLEQRLQKLSGNPNLKLTGEDGSLLPPERMKRNVDNSGVPISWSNEIYRQIVRQGGLMNYSQMRDLAKMGVIDQSQLPARDDLALSEALQWPEFSQFSATRIIEAMSEVLGLDKAELEKIRRTVGENLTYGRQGLRYERSMRNMRNAGMKLSRENIAKMAERLGLDASEFEKWFDNTPFSPKN